MNNYLEHHGIKGMHWGVRRYQNEDGSYTSAGRDRYGIGSESRMNDDAYRKDVMRQQVQKGEEKAHHDAMKKAFIAAVATVGIAGAAYACYRTGAVRRIAQAIERQRSINGKNLDSSLASSIDSAMTSSIDDAMSITKAETSKLANNKEQLAKALEKPKLVENDIVIKSGTDIKRIAFGDAGEKFDIKNAKNLYVTYNKADSATYKALLKNWSGAGKNTKYEISMKAAKDLRVPSTSAAREIFNDLWKNNPKYREALINEYLKFYKEQMPRYPEAALRKAVEQQIAADPHHVGSWAIVRHGSEAANMLVNRYKDLGYDAVLDYHDIHDGLSQNPLIVFDAYKNLTVDSIKQVSKLEEKQAQKYARKHGTSKVRLALAFA